MTFTWAPADWITENDLIAVDGCADCADESGPDFLAAVITAATEALYILTGRIIGQIVGTAVLPAGYGRGYRVELPGPSPTIVSAVQDDIASAGPFTIIDSQLILEEWYDPSEDLTLTIQHGPPVPAAARTACVDLACEALQNPTRWCSPNGVSSASYQGTSITIDPQQVRAAGLGSVKFLMELVNPLNQRQPSVCVSPDFLDLTDMDVISGS